MPTKGEARKVSGGRCVTVSLKLHETKPLELSVCGQISYVVSMVEAARQSDRARPWDCKTQAPVPPLPRTRCQDWGRVTASPHVPPYLKKDRFL